MNLSYKELLPNHFSDSSRVWIYQSSRLFSLQEIVLLEDMIDQFIADWKTHGIPVKGFGTVFFGQFVVLMADELQAGVSGCSTDSSVRLIKSVETNFGVAMFERTTMAIFVKDTIQLLPLSQFEYALKEGFIHAQTLLFDNTVTTKMELEDRWIIPIGQSWLSKRFQSLLQG